MLIPTATFSTFGEVVSVWGHRALLIDPILLPFRHIFRRHIVIEFFQDFDFECLPAVFSNRIVERTVSQGAFVLLQPPTQIRGFPNIRLLLWRILASEHVYAQNGPCVHTQDADLTDFDFFFAVAKDAAAGAARFAATADSLINDMRSGRKAPTIILVFWMKQTLLPSAVERGQGIRLSQPSSGNLACVVWTESRTNQLLMQNQFHPARSLACAPVGVDGMSTLGGWI